MPGSQETRPPQMGLPPNGSSRRGLMVDWILINEQSNINLIFVSLPFEFFQKRGPHKVGDANEFTPRCALNFDEHFVRYAGLDRNAVGSRKYFTAFALSKGVGLQFSGHSPSIIPS